VFNPASRTPLHKGILRSKLRANAVPITAFKSIIRKNFINPINFRDFCRYSLMFKNFYFGVSNFCFVSSTLLPLNIAVNLNEKMIKMTKGILVILHIFVKFNRKS
jgi:hypothetical protein